MPAAAFIIVGTVNAVNLTDGIDGLAASVTLIVSAFFAAVFYLWHMDAMLIFCACIAGALLGFLVYNFNPAKVFMGIPVSTAFRNYKESKRKWKLVFFF